MKKKTVKNVFSDIAMFFGFISAIGWGIVGGVNIAFIFPQYALLLAIIMIFTNCVVNVTTYYYVITENSSKSKEFELHDLHSWKAKGFLIIGGCFVLASMAANFFGIYVGLFFIAGTLFFSVSITILMVLTVVFATCAALSSLFFNVKIMLGLISHINIEKKLEKIHPIRSSLPSTQINREKEEVRFKKCIVTRNKENNSFILTYP